MSKTGSNTPDLGIKDSTELSTHRANQVRSRGMKEAKNSSWYQTASQRWVAMELGLKRCVGF